MTIASSLDSKKKTKNKNKTNNNKNLCLEEDTRAHNQLYNFSYIMSIY